MARLPVIQLSHIEFTSLPTDEIVLLDDHCASRNIRTSSRESDWIFYNWTDANQLRSDSNLVWNSYNRIIVPLSNKLDAIHKINKGTIYWQHLIGPWLELYLTVLLAKYNSLRSLRQRGILTAVKFPGNHIILPKDTSEFDSLTQSCEFNQFLAEILAHEMGLNCTVRQRISPPLRKKISLGDIRSKLKNIAKFFYLIISNFSSKPSYDVVCCGFNYCSSKKQTSIIRSKQASRAPRLNYPFFRNKTIRSRNYRLVSDDLVEFTSIASNLIFRFLPICFVEGYRLMNVCSQLTFPFSSRIIVDSTSFNTDELFKVWIGNERLKGSKYWIYQHGGGYESMLIYHGEILEKRLCDLYLSWGRDVSSKKSFILGVDPYERKWFRQRKSPSGILMATMGFPRYSGSMYSAPMESYQIKCYLLNLSNFLGQLSDDARKNIRIRMHPNEYGAAEKNFWLEQRIDTLKTSESFIDQLTSSSLFVCTYNATTLIQAYILNIPTIALWPPVCKIRPKAKKIFDELSSHGMLFYSAPQAANKVSSINNAPWYWWNSQSVQAARRLFLRNFAHTCNTSEALSELIQSKINLEN